MFVAAVRKGKRSWHPSSSLAPARSIASLPVRVRLSARSLGRADVRRPIGARPVYSEGPIREERCRWERELRQMDLLARLEGVLLLWRARKKKDFFESAASPNLGQDGFD